MENKTATLNVEAAARVEGVAPALALGLASIYGVFAGLNWAKLPRPEGLEVVTANVILAALYGLAWAWLRRTPHERWTEPFVAGAFLLAQTNTLNTIRLFDRPEYLVFLALGLVGFAAFSASDRWFAIGAVLMVVEWVLLRLLLGTPATELVEQGFFLVAAAGLSVAVYLVRRRGLRDLGRALRARESARNRLAAVLDSSHDLILELDADGRVAFVNEAWVRRTGRLRAEIVGTPVEETVAAASRADVRAALAAGGAVEAALLSSSGTTVEIEGRLEPLPSDGESQAGLAGFFRDVSRERELRRDLDRQEEMLRRFAEASRQVFWVFDAGRGSFAYVNDAFEELSGWTAAELLADPDVFFRLFLPEDEAMVGDLIRRTRSGESLTAEHRLLARDGTIKWVRLNVYPLRDEVGRVERIAGVSEDVTEDRRIREDLERARNRLRAREEVLWQFVRNVPAAVAMFDRDMRYLAVSDRWRKDFELEDRRLIGEGHYDVFPEIGEAWRAVHRRCLEGATERSEEDPFPRWDGTLRWLRWEVQPWRAESGEVGGLLIFSEDITEEKRLRDSLRRAARYDALTGCLNRGALEEDLERLSGRAAESGFGLFYLDLDRFKDVNDRLGHRAGDDVLVEIVERLRRTCRPGDLIGRLGGDEFVVAALGIADREALDELAGRIEDALAVEVETRAGTARVSASVGAVRAVDGEAVGRLLDRADEAMYERKRARQLERDDPAPSAAS